jgi:hypothetical protein
VPPAARHRTDRRVESVDIVVRNSDEISTSLPQSLADARVDQFIVDNKIPTLRQSGEDREIGYITTPQNKARCQRRNRLSYALKRLVLRMIAA